jgi:hypothetical protein
VAGLTLTTEERLDALTRRVADLEFEADVARLKFESLTDELGELKCRRLTVADLPVHALMDHLERLGFDAAALLHRGSITPELLATPKAA